MQLHIINQSPYSSPALDDAIAAAAPHDTMLLIDDAVYALSNKDLIKLIEQKNLVLKVLDESCKPRGIICEDQSLQISMEDMVKLTLEAQHCISWF